MALIGMGEAAKRIGVTSNSARRALQKAGVPLTVISSRSYAVEEDDLFSFMQSRGNYVGRGRPAKQPDRTTDSAAEYRAGQEVAAG